MIDRRQFVALAAAGAGAVFVSGLSGVARAMDGADDFYFVQMSDTHWGYQGAANPEAQQSLRRAVGAVNALPVQPDFIIFTGDLTHTTDDGQERDRRMAQFRDIVAGLAVKDVRFIPGEHDAALDGGAAFRAHFGPSHYAFDHKGVHFIALDNVSDPGARIGPGQLAWLRAELAASDRNVPVVVFAHRPLFDLAPEWDWTTRDGADALALLMAYPNVTVFYGHIHQEHHRMTGHIAHHAARSLIFPLPVPGSQEKRTPLPWVGGAPDHGLGVREIAATRQPSSYRLAEIALVSAPAVSQSHGGADARSAPRVVRIEARKFTYTPTLIEMHAGEPVVLELAAIDFAHGFNLPGLKLRAELVPGQVVRINVAGATAGSYPFFCDNFCGSGHEGMSGKLLVTG